ncbi:hypothetical protein [Pelomonas sp. SE-A7]|uniref:hypothetical protein n=1 Tax=Pelomonas sp. SE-A7 TaxID=3054953 RepID=UPI00259CCDE7|nr:hypothetical protein [Pelomonas sp. SE-A7]MDM4766594.1 hypothetical protein [Pelomonas sp. SE-A7]
MLAALLLVHLALLWALDPRARRPSEQPARRARLDLKVWVLPRPPAERAVEPRTEPTIKPARPVALPAPAPESTTATAEPTGEPTRSAAVEGPPAATISEGAAAARPPLRIILPKPGKPGEFSAFHNPALHDPRSNSIKKLTLEEKMGIALGTMECVLEERQPDGSIWRGGGRIVYQQSAIAAIGGAATGSGKDAVVAVCVRPG